MTDLELQLMRALQPVEPPEALARRLETTLQTLTDMAAEELEGWELSSMRDPRNWARPVAAVTLGGAAAAALVVLRVRTSHERRRTRDPLDLAERVAREVRRTLAR